MTIDFRFIHSFRIVPFGRLMFELFTNYHSLVPFPSLKFKLGSQYDDRLPFHFVS